MRDADARACFNAAGQPGRHKRYRLQMRALQFNEMD